MSSTAETPPSRDLSATGRSSLPAGAGAFEERARRLRSEAAHAVLRALRDRARRFAIRAPGRAADRSAPPARALSAPCAAVRPG